MVGRVVRPSDSKPRTHMIVAPEGGGPHVEAPMARCKLDTPERHAGEAAKRESAAMAAAAIGMPMPGKPKATPGKPKPSGVADAAKGVRVRESVVMLLEAYNSETPAQSQAIGQQQVTSAQQRLAAWIASQHPRGYHGQFSYTTGGKRASSSYQTKYLNIGSKGALVKSIQHQLGVPQTGVYDAATRAAIMRFQAQNGLTVDGIVGRQTLAALRGNANAPTVPSGPITTRQARLGLTKKKPSPVSPTPATAGPIKYVRGVAIGG